MAQKTTSFGLMAVLILAAGVSYFGRGFGAASPGLTRMNSGAGVTVKVTYLGSEGSDGVRFQVVLDTHSVDLDGYDLKSLSALRDDAGQVYSPVKVETKGGGHHRQVTLYFPQAVLRAKSLEVVIRDIAGVKERVFRWQF